MDHAWNEHLDLGNAALDHDHHTQIALVAAFADAVEQGRPALARRLGEQLGDYSRAHFRSEELLMSAAGYADAASHAKDHDMLLARIAEVNAAQAEGNSDLAVSLALDFRTELAKHIASADQRVAAAAPAHR
jgi:hemerythrin-like metal-binding protein